MTWARFDDDILMHGKWWPLSPQAFKLGIMLCVWANKYSNRSGIVPWGVIREMSGGSTRRARRLVTELIEAGKPVKEVGILEPREDGSWKIHDFERYIAPVDQQQAQGADVSDARRRAGQASAEARRARNGTAQPKRSDEHNQSGFYSTDTRSEQRSRTNVEQPLEHTAEQTSNSPRTPVPDPGRESKVAAAAAKDLTGSAREQRPAAASAAPPSAEKLSCPEDLALSASSQQQLKTSGIPDYAIGSCTVRFRAKYVGDTNVQRTLGQWQSSLAAAIHGMWNTPSQRPKPPESFDKSGPGPTKAKPSEVNEYVRSDGRRGRA